MSRILFQNLHVVAARGFTVVLVGGNGGQAEQCIDAAWIRAQGVLVARLEAAKVTDAAQESADNIRRDRAWERAVRDGRCRAGQVWAQAVKDGKRAKVAAADGYDLIARALGRPW